jgi:hypothetical protein
LKKLLQGLPTRLIVPVGGVGVGGVGLGDISQSPQVSRHASAVPSTQRVFVFLATQLQPRVILFPSYLVILSLNGESIHSLQELHVDGHVALTPSKLQRFVLLATQVQLRVILFPSDFVTLNLRVVSEQHSAPGDKAKEMIDER